MLSNFHVYFIGGYMKKTLIALCLALVLVVPATADINPPFSFTKPLCSFPFGSDNSGNRGGFFVQYDGRFWDSGFFPTTSNRPNGGIKFGVELGYYGSPAARDEAVKKVISVILVNSTNGMTYTLTNPLKYLYIGSYMADYTLLLGGAQNAIGNWKIYLVHKSGIYSAEFSITEDMISAVAPEPVDVVWIVKAISGFYVHFTPTTNANATQYRVRVFDGDDIVEDYTNSHPVNIDGENLLMQVIPYEYADKTCRVEARFGKSSWISTIDCTANPSKLNQMVPGKSSRACTYFLLEEFPTLSPGGAPQ
jgi:hypothetical protein